MGLFSVNIRKALDEDELNVVTGLLDHLSTHSDGADALNAGKMKAELASADSLSRKELGEIADLMYKAGEHMMNEKAKQGELLDPSFAATVVGLIEKIKTL